MSLLELEDVTISFGGLTAVEGASFAVNPGEVFALVGPNGAGKSTIFNLVSRYCTPSGGDIRFEGKSILGCAPHDIPRLGIARTFQNIELFEHATVLQNLLIGRHTHRRSNAISEILHLPGVRSEERRHRLAAERVIDFLDLQPYRESLIMGLPYGVRKIVELGRALAVEPKLLLLDEPASGLSAEETDDVAFWIEDIRKVMGITVLMVEHDMSLVNSVSDRVLALADGKTLVIGTPQEVQTDPAVTEAYIGLGNVGAEE